MHFFLDKSGCPGRHWFAIFSPCKGLIEIADSLAFVCNEAYLKDNLSHLGEEFVYHKLPILPGHSVLCGELAIFFCISRLLNIDLSYHEVLGICFSGDLINNEQRVREFFCETWKNTI